jgi:hypothetical protein
MQAFYRFSRFTGYLGTIAIPCRCCRCPLHKPYIKVTINQPFAHYIGKFSRPHTWPHDNAHAVRFRLHVRTWPHWYVLHGRTNNYVRFFFGYVNISKFACSVCLFPFSFRLELMQRYKKYLSLKTFWGLFFRKNALFLLLRKVRGSAYLS